MLIDYARVSTRDQDLSLQRAALDEAGCEKIYEDRKSGTRVVRAGLTAALDDLRKGDVLVVWKLDRLGRSLRHLIDLVDGLRERGVDFRSLTDQIDTATPTGRFFFNVMGSLAEMEREVIAERTRAGLDAARAAGRTGGRPRRLTNEKIAAAKQLLQAGQTYRDVAGVLGVSYKTLYTWVPASEIEMAAEEQPRK